MAVAACSAKASRSAICFAVKGRTFVRQTAMTPMAAPPWRRGAASIVLTAVARCRSSSPGYCVRTAAFRARTWTTRRSSTARPKTSRRLRGKSSPGRLVVRNDPWWAARLSVVPPARKIRASVASQRRAAVLAMAVRFGSLPAGRWGRPLAVSSAPHFGQNTAPGGGFFRHRGQVISPSRIRTSGLAAGSRVRKEGKSRLADGSRARRSGLENGSGLGAAGRGFPVFLEDLPDFARALRLEDARAAVRRVHEPFRVPGEVLLHLRHGVA